MNRLTIRPISGLFAPTAATAAVRSAPENCRSLRYFLAVAREENITHAAESLHISQPSLSKQLMELEQEVGKQLLVRGKRKITLTEEGVLLRKRADEIITLLKKTERELNAASMQIGGEVSIGGDPIPVLQQRCHRCNRAIGPRQSGSCGAAHAGGYHKI